MSIALSLSLSLSLSLYIYIYICNMLAETMLADLRARAARVCWCECTGCTYRNIQVFLLVALS